MDGIKLPGLLLRHRSFPTGNVLLYGGWWRAITQYLWGLVLGPPQISKSQDSHVRFIKWHPVCRSSVYTTCVHKIISGLLIISQFSHSVVKSYLCNPIDCSTPGIPVHHQLLKSTQTHVHRVGDAIQPSHPLLSPSPPALNLSQHQGLFK